MILTMSNAPRRLAYAYLPPSITPVTAQQRIAISPNVHQRLKHLAAKRFRGVGSISKLGTIVLDNYLGHMERAYFGHAKARACAAIPAAERDIDAVLFDMDGVLCDSEIASRRAAVVVFEQHYGVAVNTSDFTPFTGTGEVNFLNGVAMLYGLQGFDAELAKRQFFDVYAEGFVGEVKSFPGVESLVKRVKQLGLKVGVASAADAFKVNANLKAIGFGSKTFDFVTSSDDVVNKKPAPDVFLAAARGLGVEAIRCVVVEDAVAGVQAAKAAGMRCVAVGTSVDKHLLTAAGADVVRDEPSLIEVSDLFGTDVFEEMEIDEQAGTFSQPL